MKGGGRKGREIQVVQAASGEGRFPEHFAEEDGVEAGLWLLWRVLPHSPHACCSVPLVTEIPLERSAAQRSCVPPHYARTLVPSLQEEVQSDGEGGGHIQGWPCLGVPLLGKARKVLF